MVELRELEPSAAMESSDVSLHFTLLKSCPSSESFHFSYFTTFLGMRRAGAVAR